ncbi:MAG: hypothetical protein IPN59_12295 [Holophaga sp.]|nr:hypothetical protein [Holophaga sp.]
MAAILRGAVAENSGGGDEDRIRGVQFHEQDGVLGIQTRSRVRQWPTAMNPTTFGEVAVIGVDVGIEHQGGFQAKFSLMDREFFHPMGRNHTPGSPIRVIRHLGIGQIHQDRQPGFVFPGQEHTPHQCHQFIATQPLGHGKPPEPRMPDYAGPVEGSEMP